MKHSLHVGHGHTKLFLGLEDHGNKGGGRLFDNQQSACINHDLTYHGGVASGQNWSPDSC